VRWGFSDSFLSFPGARHPSRVPGADGAEINNQFSGGSQNMENHYVAYYRVSTQRQGQSGL
jgi:hypothetical protein